MAPQNSIEQEWTYTISEAQVDRFMFKVSYPDIKISDGKIILERITRSLPKINNGLI
jgi:MoxR-like ATPase